MKIIGDKGIYNSIEAWRQAEGDAPMPELLDNDGLIDAIRAKLNQIKSEGYPRCDETAQEALELLNGLRHQKPVAVDEKILAVSMGDYLNSLVTVRNPKTEDDFLRIANMVIKYVLRPYLSPIKQEAE